MAALRSQLDALAPRFWVPPGSIKVMFTPAEFYQHLCSRIKAARKRVFLASLYIGKEETELVQVLNDSLRSNSNLKVSIMTDGLRGTREAPNGTCTASLLAPLVSAFPERVRIHLYETPKMTPMLKWLLPKRLNEGVGLQHMKLYGFDDEIVLSGANLSRDYFTNRQDRYISIKDPAVTNYYWNIYSAVAASSRIVQPGPKSAGGFVLMDGPNNIPKTQSSLKSLLMPSHTQESAQIKNTDGTWVYPVCQFSPLGLGNELKAMEIITDQFSEHSPVTRWMATAGYFNIYPSLRKRLLASTCSKAQVVTASEQANGFYESKGISKYVPALYTELTRQFVLSSRRNKTVIDVKEWQNGIVNKPGGWSYHAKGIWTWQDKNECPSVTYIGSSNFTRRSYTHDIEAGAILVTDEPKLQEQLNAETQNILEHAIKDVSAQRPTLLTRVMTHILGSRL